MILDSTIPLSFKKQRIVSKKLKIIDLSYFEREVSRELNATIIPIRWKLYRIPGVRSRSRVVRVGSCHLLRLQSPEIEVIVDIEFFQFV